MIIVSTVFFLIKFFATREVAAPLANDPIILGRLICLFRHLEQALVPLANDPIISGRLIQLFRHLKHQNLSTGDDFINSSGLIFLVPFLATKETLVPLANNAII